MAKPGVQVPWSIPGWGTLEQEGAALAIQKPRSLGTVLLAGVAGYGLTCFLSIFIVGFFFGGFGDPDPRVVGGAFAAAVAVGLVVAAATLSRGSRKARLELDDAMRRLSLTSPRRDVQVRLSELAGWTVRGILNPRSVKSDGDPPHVPLLAMVTADGREQPVHVFGTDKAGPYVARKAARGLAELTRKPVVEPGASAGTPLATAAPSAAPSSASAVPAAPTVPTSVAQAMDLFRQSVRQARQSKADYGDLT